MLAIKKAIPGSQKMIRGIVNTYQTKAKHSPSSDGKVMQFTSQNSNEQKEEERFQGQHRDYIMYTMHAEKLQQQDQIWEKICKDLKWQYIPSA